MNKTPCSVCKQQKYANPKALEARLKKYGSMEGIAANWVCAPCQGHAPKRSLAHLQPELASTGQIDGVKRKRLDASFDRICCAHCNLPYRYFYEHQPA